ncbi:MAG: hypothetical protein M3Y27_23180 [Acidobacteriota bacterium]|nr:hypothetical protein [Acidobacteriota bacterium]
MKPRLLVLASVVLTCLVCAADVQGAPFETLRDGRIRHTFSGFIFPTHIGVFRRVQMRQYNQSGSDISAGYNAGALIAATVYAYPAPAQSGAQVLAREYGSKRGEVLHGHQGVAVLSEGSATISQGDKKYVGRRAYFSFRDPLAPTPRYLKSQLLVFRDGPIFIEYRFTYPRDHAEQSESEIERFIRSWSWRRPRKA